jgi:tetratricopeptide (TPR) repeat protein
MDCRRSLRLVLLLLCSVAGCETLSPWSSEDPKEKLARMRQEPSPTQSVWVEQTKLKPETLVAYAHFKEQAAVEANVLAVDQERLREQAREAYQRALKAEPRCMEAHLGLARLMETMGSHDRAVECYQQALKINPKDKDTWLELGLIHARAKTWEPALDCMRKAVALDPDDRQCVKTLGMTLARSGRYEDGFTCLKRVVGDAEARCIIARMLHHMNQDDAAREHVQLALQANPDLATAKELLAELDNPGSVGSQSGDTRE